MQLTFLFSDVRLTKTFTKDPDTAELNVSSYPMVSRFTSKTIDCPDLSTAYEALREAASKGGCLLKGNLTKPLVNESRAGKTSPNDATDYLVLDLDFADGFESIDAFLAALDPALANVSYIHQHSASAGITSQALLRGHVYIQLSEPVPAPVIKTWLMHRNLNTPALRDRISLAASAQALRWPLDITTCQNDKLIYIAPPTFINLDDPIPERFVLRTKSSATATLQFTTAPQVVKDMADTLIGELRKTAGLKRRTAKYRLINGEEVLLNPDQAAVTGIREARGYVYLNLNGGDSWAYWFPAENPTLVYNFKGEPIVRLQDIAPELHAHLTKVDTTQPKIPLMFRDWNTDTYYNGLYDATTNSLVLNPTASKERLRDFAANHDAFLPDPIPDWNYAFDPTTLTIVDFDNRWANRFIPTPFMRDSETPSTGLPTTIRRLIYSVCGNDDEAVNYFLNWLAFIFQTRRKTKTAWIFHGTFGTGKGVLLSHVLMPLFGPRYVQEYTTSNMDDNFNGNMEECIIQWLDEFNVDDSKAEGSRLVNKIKNLITEDTVMIRAMRRNPVQRRLYNNVIIATNHEDPWPLEDRDRRFNVAPGQREPLDLEQTDIDTIANELPSFAAYLRDFTVDERKAQRILRNEARTLMISAAENSVDRFFRAFHNGDIDFFLGYLRDRAPLTPDNAYIDYERAVKRWAANIGRPLTITRDEAVAVYCYLQNVRVSPNKFTSMCRKHRIDIKPMRTGSVIERAFLVTWQTNHQDLVDDFIKQTNVISLAHVG